MQATDKTEYQQKLLIHIFLGRISFLSFQEKIFLSNNIDSSNTLALLSIEEIETKINRSVKNKIKWNAEENLHSAERALFYCNQLGIRVLLNDEPEYPELLKEISDPPFILFCRGDVSILNKSCVSVVGSRSISQNGKVAAKTFGYEAVLNGCNVVSGLANGVDGYAQQGAVDAWFDTMEKGLAVADIGRTIAVLPTAIDEITPSSHKKLAAQILQTGGCLVSEYEPKMPIFKWHFVARDRLIAGISPATLVVEAPAGSGSLITADFALDYNREVMFHEACFGPMAQEIARGIRMDLEKRHAAGQVSKYKLENTPEKFLEAGAVVVKDYKDYCEALKEAPGKRIKVPVQGELF